MLTNNWHIGYAQADITPGKGQTLMAGYGRQRYAAGVHKPLRAQAIALRDSRGRLALLITADILGFDRLSVEYLRRALSTRHQLDPQAIMLSASHTHWGPPTLYRVTFAVGTPDTWLVAALERTLLALAEKAINGLEPGAIDYAYIETNVGHSRRIPRPDGTVEWAPNPDNDYDRHTPILRMTRQADDVDSIILVGHACHPTASGGIDKFTPDWPGAMRDRIESRLGARTRAVFVMGCGADAKATHKDPETGELVFTSDPLNSARAGRELAKEVVHHLKQESDTRSAIPASLRCRVAAGDLTMGKCRSTAHLRAIALQSDNMDCEAWWARQMLAYPDSRRNHHYEVQSWVLGGVLTVFGLEGEVCSPLGPLSRGLAKTPHAMIVAYANEVQGYIPSRKIVQEGGYEGDSSHRAYFKPAPFTPRVEAEFKAIVQRALK